MKMKPSEQPQQPSEEYKRKAKGDIFGHKAEWRKYYVDKEKDGWYYLDNGDKHISQEGIPCGVDINPRRCPKCNLYPTKEGHDPCIAGLPGVAFACCGHGVKKGYVKFTNGVILRGVFTLPKEEQNESLDNGPVL